MTNKKKKIPADVYAFMRELIQESLRDWFKKEKWVRISSSGNIAGDCGTSKNKKNPDRCLPKAKAQSLTKGQRAATAAKKKKAGKKGKTVVKNTKKATVKKEGLWANINAKKKAGKKSSHKNSNAYKDAKKAGNALKQEGEGNEREIKGQELVDYIMGHWGWSEDKTLNWLANNFGKNKQDDGPKEKNQDYIDYLRRSGRDNEADKLVALNPDKVKETKGAPKGHYFTKSGNLVKGRLTKDAQERGARLSDPKDKQRSKVPAVTQYKEQIGGSSRERLTTLAKSIGREEFAMNVLDIPDENVLDMIVDELAKLYDMSSVEENVAPNHNDKAAPFGSGYKKVTKEDIANLVVGLLHEREGKEVLMEKDDRCTRLAKSKYDTWPSAYASGAVVRCRRGEIWKKK